jgi:hypothetical protein
MVDQVILSLNGSWPGDRALGCRASRELIAAGHPRRAYDLIKDGLRNNSDDAELNYLAALSLARGRNIAAAERIALSLLKRSDLPQAVRSDALSLLGRLSKDRCIASAGPRRAEFASASAKAYLEAMAISDDPFPVINAATMLRVVGSAEQSKALAEAVVNRLNCPVDSIHDYWTAVDPARWTVCG